MRRTDKKSNRVLNRADFRVIFLFLLISLLVLSVWYKSGRFIGGGEVALHFWDIDRYINMYRWPWIEKGLGAPWVLALPKLPLLYIINSIPSINVTWLHQSIFFLITLFLGTIGVYLLTLEITQEENRTQAFLAAFFYLFNPYTVSQVFGRFIYAGMLAWGFLPFFLLIVLKWLRKDRSFSLVKIATTFIIFSYVFSQPAYVIVYWLVAFLVFLSEFLVTKKNRLILIKRFITLFLLWLFVNAWWLYPYVTLGFSSLEAVGGYKYNFDSLRGVSKYGTTSQILTLRQGFYIGEGGIFYPYYSQGVINILSIVALITAVIGWFLTKTKKYRVHFSVFTLVAWFICKGTNRPLGYSFYNLLFSNFPITYGLRNPYEKFGIIWTLVYSILFALGAIWIINRAKGAISKFAIVVGFILISLFLGEPIIDGTTFSEQLYITVPEYYNDINLALNKDKNDGRVFMLPINYSDGVKYKWGYEGVEPSEHLVDKPVLGSIYFESIYNNRYKELYDTPISDPRFYILLNELNISYLVFNNDNVNSTDDLVKVEEVKNLLMNNKNFEEIGNFGALTLYRNLDNAEGLVFGTLDENASKISYVKESPTRYRISVVNAKSPFTLVFKSLFNDSWEARIEGVSIHGHDMIYHYANAWEIDKTGSYLIDVIFKVWPWE
jgi:hypothetical protein